MTGSWRDWSKKTVRAAVGTTCRLTRMLQRAEQRQTGRLTILCYHRILPAGRKAAYFIPDLVVTPEAFSAHCDALRRHYEVLPLAAALRRMRETDGGDRPLAAITFDDGYRDNHTYAADVLARHGLTATFFVIADLAESTLRPWYDCLGQAASDEAFAVRVARWCRTQDVKPPAVLRPRQVVAWAKTLGHDVRASMLHDLGCDGGPDAHDEDLIMTWTQLRELAANGHEIGSHSATHDLLPGLADDRLDAEVAGSRRTIEDRLQSEVTSFCYPNGDIDQRVRDAVEASGYHCAVTVAAGDNDRASDPFMLARRFIHEDRIAGPACEASYALARMEFCGLADQVFRRAPAAGGAV